MLNTTTRELFPTLVPTLEQMAPEVLDTLCDLSDYHTVAALYTSTVVWQSSLNRIEILAETSRQHLAEIIIVKTDASEAEAAVLDFLQLGTATGVLGQCVVTAQYARAADWFIACLNDEMAFGEMQTTLPADVERLNRVLQSEHRFVRENASMLISQWVELAYFYMRKMKAFHEVGALAFPFSMAATLTELANQQEQGLKAMLRLTEWAAAAEFEETERLALSLEELYEGLPGPLAAQVAATLASAVGGRTRRGSLEWAKVAYTDHWDDIGYGGQVMVLGGLINVEGYLPQYEEKLLKTISDISDHLSGRSPFDREQFLEGLFQALYPALNFLLTEGCVLDTLKVLGAWYGGQPELLSSAIIAVPLRSEGTLWCTETNPYVARYPAVDTIHRYFEAMNHALRIVINHEGFTGLESDPAPRNTALPDLSWGDRFESTSADLLGVYDAGFEANNPKDQTCVLMTSMPLPLQAICSRSVGYTWPMSVSLEKAHPERVVRRVGIWSHPLKHGELEVEIVTKMMNSTGATVRLEQSGTDDELDRFKSLYQDESLDVLWVIGHGERVPYAPDQSELQIFEHASLRITDLQSHLTMPDIAQRRLLFLNVCSAGGTVTYGGLARVGIASMLTNQGQSTISHLWPIDATVATAFGALLAFSISRGNDFFSAYCETMSHLKQANEEIAERCQQSIDSEELASLVLTSPNELRNILLSGSAIFLQ